MLISDMKYIKDFQTELLEMKTIMCKMKIYLIGLMADQTFPEGKITEFEDRRNSPKLKQTNKKRNKEKKKHQ